MADLSPFVSQPQDWVETLAQLREERQKIEAKEDRYKTKLRAHFEANSIESLEGKTHCASLEKRSSIDFSRKTLLEVFGAEWLEAVERRLPTKTTEFLVVRKLKEEKSKPEQIAEFFGAETDEQKGKPKWEK